MSRRMAWGLIVAGVMLAPSAQARGDDPKGEQAAERAGGEAKPERGTAPENADVIKKIYAQSTLDAETAKIATQKSKDERVTRFADDLARDHKRLEEKLEDLGKARHLELSKETALSSGQKAHLDAMKAMSTSEFETHFAQMMTADHEKLLKDLDTAAEQADRTGDRELAALVQETRPSLKEHRTVAASLGRGGASPAGSAGSKETEETPSSTGPAGEPAKPGR